MSAVGEPLLHGSMALANWHGNDAQKY
eukprot:COSAG01_NODE_69968_length_260_cov_0.478261_1_plen_26_part_01